MHDMPTCTLSVFTPLVTRADSGMSIVTGAAGDAPQLQKYGGVYEPMT